MDRTFSVIIPTRERADTLVATLRSAARLHYDRVEIIVSDNCSQDKTRQVVESFDDPRIRYVNTGRRVSMSDNWEFALSHACGEWVAIIGDDDALLPTSLTKVNEIADATGVQAVRSSTCSYVWPGNLGLSHGALLVPMSTGYQVRDCRKWLMYVLSGRAAYRELPMLYNGGFVSMDVVRAAKRDGRFYRSCIPDVYSAVAISHVLDRYAYCQQPLVVDGASRHSTGASQFSKDGSTGPSKQFQSEPNIPIHSSFPKSDDGDIPKSLLALVYESCAQAAEVLPDVKRISPKAQLTMILASAGAHRSSIEQWGREYARMHDIEFDIASASAARLKVAQSFRELLRMLSTCADVEVSGQTGRIEDVDQAGITADAIIRSRLSMAVRVANSRLLKRITRYWSP